MPRLPDLPGERTIPQIISKLRAPDPSVDTAWYKAGPSEPHGIDFENGWSSSVGASFGPFGWMMDETGRVHLRGRITGGDYDTTIITLPEEMRPKYNQSFIIAGSDEAHFHIDGVSFRSWQRGDMEDGTENGT